MTKLELAKDIAKASFPPHVDQNCPAVTNFIAGQMKFTKIELQSIHFKAMDVLYSRGVK